MTRSNHQMGVESNKLNNSLDKRTSFAILKLMLMLIAIRSLDERPARIRRQRGLERGGSHDVERADRYLGHYCYHRGCSM